MQQLQRVVALTDSIATHGTKASERDLPSETEVQFLVSGKRDFKPAFYGAAQSLYSSSPASAGAITNKYVRKPLPVKATLTTTAHPDRSDIEVTHG